MTQAVRGRKRRAKQPTEGPPIFPRIQPFVVVFCLLMCFPAGLLPRSTPDVQAMRLYVAVLCIAGTKKGQGFPSFSRCLVPSTRHVPRLLDKFKSVCSTRKARELGKP